MDHTLAQSSSSWLSLVAETAGVSGATITRVELGCDAAPRGSVRCALQVLDARGNVIGATYWEGQGSDLEAGVNVDLGCDLGAGWGCQVVAWIDRSGALVPARTALPGVDAVQKRFDSTVGMKLMLNGERLDDDLAEAA